MPKKTSSGHPLNGTEVALVAGGARKVNVYVYPDLQEFETIEEAFGPKRGIMLLYVHTNPNEGEGYSGHWTSLLLRTKDEIVYTDSYGDKLDKTLTDYSDEHRQDTKQAEPRLTILLRDWAAKDPENRRVVYDDQKFQRKDRSIATCGRWAAFRLRYPDMDQTTYENSIKAAAKEAGVTADKLITDATNAILKTR
jgi:hypothetical protein